MRYSESITLQFLHTTGIMLSQMLNEWLSGKFVIISSFLALFLSSFFFYSISLHSKQWVLMSNLISWVNSPTRREDSTERTVSGRVCLPRSVGLVGWSTVEGWTKIINLLNWRLGLGVNRRWQPPCDAQFYCFNCESELADLLAFQAAIS